jgi:uncharacterized membrane protein YeaQ/YmgE (transglycosylase-associated protein family)
MIPLIIQLISGAVGGNIAGAILKNLNLGPIGNSIAGIVGGGIGVAVGPSALGTGSTYPLSLTKIPCGALVGFP